MGFPYTYVVSEETDAISMGKRRERHRHPWAREGKVMDALGNMLVQGHTKAQEFLGLSVVYNSLSRPLSLLPEP
jgi:hypothetical protein